MKPTPSLVSTPVCIDLFGPIFLGENVFGGAFESIFQIIQIADPQNIFVFCGPPQNEQRVGLLLEISGFFAKTGLLPTRLIFSEKRPNENFKVIISSDLGYLANLEKRTIRILIGCDSDILQSFLQEVVFKAPDDEPPKWDTLLTVPDWGQNFNIILNWIGNPEKILAISKPFRDTT